MHLRLFQAALIERGGLSGWQEANCSGLFLVSKNQYFCSFIQKLVVFEGTSWNSRVMCFSAGDALNDGTTVS